MFSKLKENIKNSVNLKEDEWAILKEKFTPKRYAKNEFFIREGDPSNFEAFVSKGCFQVYHINDKGNKHVIYFAPEDYWLIDPSSFNNKKASLLYIQAIEDSEILTLTLQDKDDILEKIPALEKYYRQLLESVYEHSHHGMISRSGKTAKEKYIQFVTENQNLKNRLSNVNIANYLDLTPEIISRVRKEFYTEKQ
ncbi:Crp/Fnr family transcriptional regulator [Zunongwangia endophytica]|uniref:Crp/Fnr family transcriptional regulator n=1 Tax=Zunongwangia endophytica TaxID=1808945 RepID=A0ABV8H7W2_9FLAO|nr:Crp/Fnr family transcriptional regulator [Zunongwangia endophytica]MDN3595170.1 Crp/Fnr family transcriptional regulator [Zunongwangia endophytica]